MQEEKERLKAQVTAASQGNNAIAAQSQDKHGFIASLQVCTLTVGRLCCLKQMPGYFTAHSALIHETLVFLTSTMHTI